jgi:oxygen-independent coproporphyrinogen-3 oxidase
VYGVYAHVPWCRVRCPYCAFAVDTRREPAEAEWVAGVLRDWDRERVHFDGPPATLAFGGGTPSRADPASLAAVVEAIGPTHEIGMEANPEDVSGARVRAWRDLGVGRVSLGVQTFDPRVAPGFGRAHSAGRAAEALDRLMQADFRSVSVDLLFGDAAQSPEGVAADVDRAARAGVHHVSLYALTIEPGTRFSARGRAGAAEEAWLAQHDAAQDRLLHHGFERYEVSNHARPGHRARHNEHYWRARRWAGLGPSAHGWRPDGWRVANVEDFDGWAAGAPPALERPGGEALLYELVWSTLRHVDGVDVEGVAALTGFRLVAEPALVASGVLRLEEGFLRLAPAAFNTSDAVVERLVRRAVPV